MLTKKTKNMKKIYFPNKYYYYDLALKQKVSKRRVNRIKFRLYIRNFYAVEVIIIAVEEVLGWCREVIIIAVGEVSFMVISE
jgi:hypothetical protein